MDDGQPSATDLAALRSALLDVHEAFLGPLPSRRTQRVLRRLHRAHLSWLLAPWFLVKTVGIFWSARRQVAVEARVVGLYGQHSGKDPHVAQAEVDRMLWQLLSLDERDRWVGEERPGAPPGADRAELAAATGALLGYYLAGRRTDDALLGEVEAAWAEYERLTHWHAQDVHEEGRRRGRPAPDHEARVQAANDRYLLAWRRWLDRRAQLGTAGRPGDGSDG